MKQIFIFTTIAIFLIGCGGGSDSSDSSGETPSNDQKMVIAEPYTVYPGNTVTKTSLDALVKISHSDATNITTVQLVEGNATIIRN